MLTKGAIGNLVNRYRAVLKKCNLINTFGSLAVASMLVLGGTGVAEAGMTVNGAEYTGGRFIGDGELVIANQTMTGSTAALYAGKNEVGVESAVATITDSIFEGNEGSLNWAIYGGSRSAGSQDIEDGQSVVKITNSSGFLDVFGGGCKTSAGTFSSESSTVVVSDSQFSGSGTAAAVYKGRVFGAGKASADGVTMTFEKTDVSITNVYGSVTIDGEKRSPGTQVVGGGFIFNTPGAKLVVKDALVTIDGAKTALELVAGGSYTSGSNSTGILDTHKTKVVIKNGYIKEAVGGNRINFFGGPATLGSSEVVVDGGKVDLVVGGNHIDIGLNINAERRATAKSTSVTINGGTFGDVVGGGYSINKNENQKDFDVDLQSTVENASVSIANATVSGNVIGGGLGVGYGASGSTTKSVSVTVKNSTIAGTITTDNMHRGDTETIVATKATSAVMSLTNVKAGAVVASKGTVELRAEGNGTTSIGSLSVGKDVSVALTADGAANDAAGGDITKVIMIADGDFNATINMEEGLISGAVVNGVQKTNTVMQDTLDMATAAPLAISRIVMNDVRKRMGDLRSTKEDSGVWMRWEGGKLKGDAGLTNDFNTIQVGADTKVGKNCRFGVAGAFTHGDLDHRNGEGENETFSFSAYGTWMADNGMFADVIARVGFSNTETTVKNTRIDLDNEVLSLSAEYGWRLPVCQQFFVEPQVELTYTYVSSADSKVQYATYDIDSVDSLIGRAGLVAGWNLPDDMGNVYARASVVREFLGDGKITGTAFGNSIAYENDGDDTWLEYGIGANIKLTEKTYIWADVERTAGADLDEEWRGTVGLRYSF